MGNFQLGISQTQPAHLLPREHGHLQQSPHKALMNCSPTKYEHSSKSTLTPEWEFFVITNQLLPAHDFEAQASRTQWPAQNPS